MNDRQVAFNEMHENRVSRVLFSPNDHHGDSFSSLIYATDQHPNDGNWANIVLETFPGKLTMLHVSERSTLLDRDVFVRHSEQVLEHINCIITFRLLQGLDPVQVVLRTADDMNGDMVFLPCSNRAMVKNLSGTGFIHRFLDQTRLPVMVFNG